MDKLFFNNINRALHFSWRDFLCAAILSGESLAQRQMAKDLHSLKNQSKMPQRKKRHVFDEKEQIAPDRGLCERNKSAPGTSRRAHISM